MKTNCFYARIAAMAIVCTIAAACGSTKKASTGYSANQTKPTTDAQASAANRGLKVEKEECEDMALMPTDNLRAAGNAQSESEQFATNLAMLDARSNLAQQVETWVKGMLRSFDEQHKERPSSLAKLVSKASQEQQGYFDRFLTNTRPICKNTYVKEDGSYNVYVCIEMGPQMAKAVYKKLSDEGVLDIDYSEHLFLQDMVKAKEEFLQMKQSEQ